MKIAVLSDIHSNHYAFKACLDWIEQHQIHGIAFLGDYISDCPYPQKTMALMRMAAGRYPCWFVKGNREEYMIDRSCGNEDSWYGVQAGSLQYTYDNLTEEDIHFFSSMPSFMEVSMEGYPAFGISHGDFHKSRARVLPGNEAADRLLEEMQGTLHCCGHTHKPFIYEKNGKVILNPGTVGVPGSGSVQAEMAVVEFDKGRWKPQLVKVEYDIERAVQEFYESGLAEQSGVWARAIIAMMKTGRHYCDACISLVKKYEKETGKSFADLSLWQRAAEELGI